MPNMRREHEPSPIEPQAMEYDASSAADQKKLKDMLASVFDDEAIDQLIFILQTIAAEDYTNHCNEATKALGGRLLERYGEEESFDDLAPTMEFSDVRSYEKLREYRGDFHSVGVISVHQPKKKMSIIIDPTHYVVSSDAKPGAMLVLKVEGDTQVALKALGQRYGGLWIVDCILDKKHKQFRSLV